MAFNAVGIVYGMNSFFRRVRTAGHGYMNCEGAIPPVYSRSNVRCLCHLMIECLITDATIQLLWLRLFW
jgi:hypothetical protein